MADDSDRRRKRNPGALLGELLWAGPALGLVAVLVVVGFTLSNSGSRLAAVGIAVTGFCSIVFIAAYRVRLAHEVGAASIARWRWPSLGVTVALVVAGVFVPQAIAVDSPPHEESRPAGPVIVSSGDDGAASYLAADKTVVIGINGRLPGWSFKESNGTYTGFDVDLAEFLRDKYGFTLRFKELFQNSRETQWDGKTVDPADLVISAFSITEKRRSEVGMAGPYYIDMSTMWINGGKEERYGAKVAGCAVPGTSGSDEMNNVKNQREKDFQDPFEVTTEMDLAGCLARYFSADDKTGLVFSDWSIIRASKPKIPLVRYSDKAPLDDLGPPSPGSSTERYGIAFRPGHPRLCRDLTKAIDEFIANEGKSAWTDAFTANLAGRSVSNTREWHRPAKAEEGYCGPGGSD
ncbi:substrate-binding periplasmic protein [Actinokineospora terrae]|uniref:ABC-type amino acid transport substrate-binding protein n=1 Tax=Actinokineospora terrae TaxID=155974 RepID=A0A1H9WCJ5_9PSEU|nr:transporter substrate-binding domain-containing protein [Actinokineospora terrae]SES31387.1 ABC-type amino acid transport substrate-binding protein [Actinokineospora terrae]